MRDRLDDLWGCANCGGELPPVPYEVNDWTPCCSMECAAEMYACAQEAAREAAQGGIGR